MVKTLADTYCYLRNAHPTKPAAWSRGNPEHEADWIDSLYLAKVVYPNHGRSIVFPDGSIAVKRLLFGKSSWVAHGS